MTTLETVSGDDDSSIDCSVDSWESGFEAGNNDAMEDFFGDDPPDDYWLAEDQLKEFFYRSNDGGVKVPPPLSDWKLKEPQHCPIQIY